MKIFYIYVAFIGLMAVGQFASAETVKCDGVDQESSKPITVNIRAEKRLTALYPSLVTEVKLGKRWLAHRRSVGLNRSQSGLVYRDRVFPEGLNLFLYTQSISPGEFEGSLVLNAGMANESKYKNLKCKVEGEPMYAVSWCPESPDGGRELLDVAKNGSARDLQNLLGCHVDVNTVDKNSCSALHFVTDMSCGQDSSQAGFDAGRGPLVAPKMIEILFKAGASPNKRDRFGNTPLLNAARSGEPSSASVLVDFDADLDAQDHKGNTALMYAVLSGDEHLVRTLLNGRPDLSLKNLKNSTASDLAETLGLPYIKELVTKKSSTQYVITGNPDGTCSPEMIHIMNGEDVEIVLDVKSEKMFLLEAPDLDLELMAMPKSTDSKVINPTETGTFPFTCGVHGGDQQTNGSFMVM